MSEEQGRIKALLADLERLRGELSVQLHLGKAEAKDEWARLEKRWQELQAKLKPFSDTADDTARNVGSAFELAAEELKSGYDRFRKLL